MGRPAGEGSASIAAPALGPESGILVKQISRGRCNIASPPGNGVSRTGALRQRSLQCGPCIPGVLRAAGANPAGNRRHRAGAAKLQAESLASSSGLTASIDTRNDTKINDVMRIAVIDIALDTGARPPPAGSAISGKQA